MGRIHKKLLLKLIFTLHQKLNSVISSSAISATAISAPTDLCFVLAYRRPSISETSTDSTRQPSFHISASVGRSKQISSAIHNLCISIREFGIRNAKINRVNELFLLVYLIYFCVSYPELVLLGLKPRRDFS